MIFKLFAILFVGFLSTYIGEIKAEEICYYSNSNEYKKCIKEKPNLIRKVEFPFKIGNYAKYVIWEYGSSPRNFLQINLVDEKKIDILGGTNFGPFIFSKYKGKKYLEINKKDIYYWKKKFVVPKYPYWAGVGSFKYESYEIGYLNEFGEINEFLFLRNILNFTGDEIFSDVFKEFLNSESGETKDLENLISTKLYNNEKELTIIKSAIHIDDNKEKKCFEAKTTSFPDLILRYKKLFKTIKPLRVKLNLPVSSNLKPICD